MTTTTVNDNIWNIANMTAEDTGISALRNPLNSGMRKARGNAGKAGRRNENREFPEYADRMTYILSGNCILPAQRIA